MGEIATAVLKASLEAMRWLFVATSVFAVIALIAQWYRGDLVQPVALTVVAASTFVAGCLCGFGARAL